MRVLNYLACFIAAAIAVIFLALSILVLLYGGFWVGKVYAVILGYAAFLAARHSVWEYRWVAELKRGD